MKVNQLSAGVFVIVITILGLIYYQSMNTNTNSEQTSNTMNDQKKEQTNSATEEKSMMQGTIVDIAVSNGNFTTLVAAVKAAGLAETLSGPGPFTVFAPTDEAFAKLPPGTAESLLADKEALTKILTYHVVSGKVMSADVVKLAKATTLQGQEVTVSVDNGSVKINESMVVQADIEGSNGVIHVIDIVLMPE